MVKKCPIRGRKCRLNLEVILRILNELYKHNRMLKTHLYMASRQNYTNFQKYLNYLLERGLILIRHGSSYEYVELTREGKELIEKIVKEIKEKLKWEL